MSEALQVEPVGELMCLARGWAVGEGPSVAVGVEVPKDCGGDSLIQVIVEEVPESMSF